MTRILKRVCFPLLLAVSAMVAAEEVSKEQIKGLDEQVQEIKKDVLAISTDLNLLEEKLLYPSNTQVSLFVSLKAGESFRLDAVEIELDGKSVAHHIYSFKELEALRAGGLQRIYTGNIRTGEHQLKVGYIAKSSLNSDVRKEASYRFEKGVAPGIVEITIAGSAVGAKGIDFKDW